MKRNLKTEVPPKLSQLHKKRKGDGKNPTKEKKHRDAHKVNKATCEVNAEGWSSVLDNTLQNIGEIFASYKDRSPEGKANAFDLLQPFINNVAEAHQKSRENARKSSTILKSYAPAVANAELSAIRRDVSNGKNPHENQSVVSSDTDMIDAYMETINIDLNALESKMQVTTPHEESASNENPSTPTPPIVQSPTQLPTIVTPPPEMPPPPTHTAMYSPYEISELYVQYMKKKGMNRLKLLQVLGEYAGNRSKANLYRKIKEFKAGKLDVTQSWNDFGRPKKLASISEPINILINKERAVHGHNVPIRIVRDIAKQAIHQEWLDKGGEGEYNEPCRTTIETYCKRVLAVPSVNINKSVTNKNETRYSAENSIRSSIAYSMAVATQHWWKGKPKKGFHLMDDDDMCKGARIGRELAQEFHATKELQHVLPGLVTSSDGTTFFCTVGQVEEKDSVYITINPPKDTNGTSADSSYRSHSSTARHGDRHKRGVRIEVICTFNADGQIAALFCVVYGLSILEMPDDEIITLDIAGLVSGGHQFLSCVEKGFVSFVRGKVDETGNLVDEQETINTDITNSEDNERTISKEARITKIYRDLVYYPFIDKIRRDTYGWDGEMDFNGNVPDYLTAVGWVDGANGQMSLTTGEESLKQDDI